MLTNVNMDSSNNILTVRLDHDSGPRRCVSFSEDCKISVLTDEGIHVVEMKLTEDGKQVKHRRSLVTNPVSSPSLDVDIDTATLFKSLSPGCAKNRLLLDRSLMPDISHPPHSNGFKLAKWSPGGADGRGRCILTTLTYAHQVILYEADNKRHTWQKIVDLNEKYLDMLKTDKFCKVDQMDHLDYATTNETLSTLINRKYAVSTVDMEWSKMYKSRDSTDAPLAKKPRIENTSPEYALLFSLMKSGHVLIWKILFPCQGSKDCHLLSKINTGCSNPTSLCWCPTSTDEGIIAVGDLCGQVTTHLITNVLSSDDIQCKGNETVWTEKDRLAVNSMCWSAKDRLLLVGKVRYLVAFSLGVEDNVITAISQTVPTRNCEQFTDFTRMGDSVLVATNDRLLYSLTQDDEKRVLCHEVELPFIKSCRDFVGLAPSANDVFLAYVIKLDSYKKGTRTKDIPRCGLYIFRKKELEESCHDFLEESPSLKSDCLMNIALLAGRKSSSEGDKNSSSERKSGDKNDVSITTSSDTNHVTDSTNDKQTPVDGDNASTLEADAQNNESSAVGASSDCQEKSTINPSAAGDNVNSSSNVDGVESTLSSGIVVHSAVDLDNGVKHNSVETNNEHSSNAGDKHLAPSIDFTSCTTKSLQLERFLRRCGMDKEAAVLFEVINLPQLHGQYHVLRMSQSSIPGVALRWTPPGKHKRGRPKTTRRRTIESELEELGVSWNGARLMAKDRKQWRIVQVSCSARNECQSSGELLNEEEQLLKRHFCNKLDVLNLASPSDLLPLSRWLSSKTSQEYEPLQTSVAAFEKSLEKEEEKCIVCDESFSFDSIYQSICGNGHTAARCCQSLVLCQDPILKSCPMCQSKALLSDGGSPWLQQLLSWRCTFCDSLMNSQ